MHKTREDMMSYMGVSDTLQKRTEFIKVADFLCQVFSQVKEESAQSDYVADLDRFHIAFMSKHVTDETIADALKEKFSHDEDFINYIDQALKEPAPVVEASSRPSSKGEGEGFEALFPRNVLHDGTTVLCREKIMLRRIRMGAFENSILVAQAALTMKNWFYWAGSSGPDPNDKFKIKTKSTRTEGDFDNDFALWIRHKGPEPTKDSKMNCWEAVLFSAYKAGVISYEELVEIHKRAAESRRKENANFNEEVMDQYNVTLMDALGYKYAMSIDPERNIVPEIGDVLFFDGNEHVALSLGRGESGRHQMLSLWRNDNNNLMEITIDQLEHYRKFDKIKFAPWPF
jgi:hypothetical protein